MTPFGYIYETTNLVNNKKYIGKRQSSKFQRFYFGSGINLRKAIKKYGKENFSVNIIAWCYTKEELIQREIEEIKNRNAYESEKYYNIARGGEGGDTYAGKLDAELALIKNKISNANKGSNNGNKGQYIGNKNSMFGKHHSLESRQKMSQANKKRLEQPGQKTGKHSWTKEMETKRKERRERISYLWTIYNKNRKTIIRNFTLNKNFIKYLYKDVYNSISKFEWSELKRFGILNKDYLEIHLEIIDKTTISKEILELYESYYTKYKQFVGSKKLNKSVSTIESIIQEKDLNE